MALQQMSDEELHIKFETHRKAMMRYVLIGIVLSIVFIGIPIVIYGFFQAFQLTQTKNEMRRRGLIS